VARSVFRRSGIGTRRDGTKKGRVTVPDLPGCVATGKSIEETEESIREAIAFHLDGLREDNLPIPPASSRVDYVEVAA